MSIEVVPQPRLDQLVRDVGGTDVRRTDHRGVVWFGGRQAPQLGGALVIRKQPAVIASPFWLPDSLAYRTDAVDRVRISFTAAVLFVAEHSALAQLDAWLAPNESNPGWSHVMVRVQGSAHVPLGLSYDLTVLAPPEAVAPG